MSGVANGISKTLLKNKSKFQILKKFFFAYVTLQRIRPHGGLSQLGRSNRPMIRPGIVKSLNVPRELS